MLLLDIKITYEVKTVCLHCTIAVSHAQYIFKSYNLILKVVFLFMELHTWKPSVQNTVYCTLYSV